MKISKIILYDEPSVPEIQLRKMIKFLEELFPIKVELRESFFQNLDHRIFKKIASTRVLDLKKPFQKIEPSIEDIEKEKKDNLTANIQKMIFHDGFEMENILAENIPEKENQADTLHVIFTNKLLGTFDESDYRYHARTIIGANPSIISITGMIEAPAKPKQYYIEIMTAFSQTKKEEIKRKYKEEYLEYHDSRLSDIVEGYLLQIVMYYETGEAFCKKPECRLFNAHWQKELFESQLKNKKFCSKHKKILNELKKTR